MKTSMQQEQSLANHDTNVSGDTDRPASGSCHHNPQWVTFCSSYSVTPTIQHLPSPKALAVETSI